MDETPQSQTPYDRADVGLSCLWDHILRWATKIGNGVSTWDLEGRKPAGELVLIGDGLEQWADATLAANFFVEFLIDGPDHHACLEICQDLSRNWRDRSKAAAFVAVQQEITEDIQRQFDEDWEAEHGSTVRAATSSGRRRNRRC